MAKLVTTNLVSGAGSHTAINNNFDLVETAFENTLSRDGTTPNSLSAQLDLGSNRIINIANAVNNQDALTLAQANTLTGLNGPLTRSGVGAVLYPRTAAEVTEGITPTDEAYPVGFILRYGVNPGPSTDMVAIINDAISVMNTAGGGTVLLEQGVVHAVDPGVSPIIMKPNVTLDLHGSDIQRIGANTTARMIENDDYQAVSVDSNIHIISTGARGRILGTGSTTAISDQGAGIGWFGLKGPWSIRNIYFDDTNGDGISWREVGTGYLEDIEIDTFGRNGISPTSNLTDTRVYWENVIVNGPIIAGANPGIGINAETNNTSETTDMVWTGVKSLSTTFADLFTVASGAFDHKIQMNGCEFGPVFKALHIISTNITNAASFYVGADTLCEGLGTNGPAVTIKNVNGVVLGGRGDCAASTGVPIALLIEGTVDNLKLRGFKAVNADFGLQSFSTARLNNSEISDCDLGAIYLGGLGNTFSNTQIAALTINGADSIDNKFIESRPTSGAVANSGDLSAQRYIATPDTEIVSAINVITAIESGKTFYLNLVGGFTSTLPTPGNGLKFKFVVTTAPTTAYIITTNAGANILEGTFLDIVGELQAIAAQDTLNFVASASLVGDSLEVESDGTNWYCTAFSKADGGITVSVT